MKPFYSPEEKIARLEEFAALAERALGLEEWSNKMLGTSAVWPAWEEQLRDALLQVREVCNWPDPGAQAVEQRTPEANYRKET